MISTVSFLVLCWTTILAVFLFGPKGWLALILLLMFAGALVTSFVEYKLQYNLYETIREKIFRRKTGAPGAR